MNTRSGKKMGDLNELKKILDDVKTTLGTKIDGLAAKLEEKDKRILELENTLFIMNEKMAYNDKRFELLERRIDDSEQYSRRTSLRINGINYEKNETAAQCLEKVKKEVTKLGIKLDDCEFDRAHRIGRSVDGKDRQMIVKFATFRARTLVYRNRNKDGKNEAGKVKFYIDQTKRRFDLRKMAVDYCEEKPQVDFVFVDINCNLCLRFKSGEFKFFNSKEELVNIVG